MEQKETNTDDPQQVEFGAIAGLAPVISLKCPLTHNMVYLIPPPPLNVFYSKEVIEKAKTLHLYHDQEHMTYKIAKTLTNSGVSITVTSLTDLLAFAVG